MKKVFSLCFFLFSAILLQAQLNFQWAFSNKFFGGGGSVTSKSIKADNSGNVFVAGNYSNKADFDPGIGVADLVSVNSTTDIFIAKYDSLGNYIYALSIGGTGADAATSITIAPNGDILVCGTFEFTVDFDAGGGTYSLNSNGLQDIFLARYTSAGVLVFARSFGDFSTEHANAVTVDADGNAWITGDFYGAIDFDPGSASATLTSLSTRQLFLAKYDASGNYLWAGSVDGIGGSEGIALAVDATNNVLLTGYFSYTIDFDPGSAVANLVSNGSSDIFFAKYDLLGNYLFAKSVGGISNEFGNSIASDNLGNIYITGSFAATVDFDPGAAVVNLTAGVNDIYLAKYDAGGNYVFAKNMASTIGAHANSVALDESDNIYITGAFEGNVDLDPGTSVSTLTSSSSSGNTFIAGYDNAGNFMFGKGLNGIGYNEGNALAISPGGEILITGSYINTVDFDPDAGTVNYNSEGGFPAGYTNAFFGKYTLFGSYTWAKPLGGYPYSGTGSIRGSTIKTDAAGNIHVAGSIGGIYDFDPGIGEAYLKGNSEIFLSQYDPSGNYIYSKVIRGARQSYTNNSLTIDAHGNTYIAGEHAVTIYFSATDSLPGSGGFIAKYDAAGNFVYSKNIIPGSMFAINSFCADAAGNLYVGGNFQGTYDFDPGAGVANLTSLGDRGDMFFAKYDVTGNYVFARQLVTGYTGIMDVNCIVTDSIGNIFIAGAFNETVDFDPGPGTANISGGSISFIPTTDAFFAKYDASGNYIYARKLGSTNNDNAFALGTDSIGNCYVAGYFANTLDFDPGAGVANMTSNGLRDCFIAKYDQAGNYVQELHFGGIYNDEIADVYWDKNGNAYATGYFQYIADMDPSVTTANLISNGFEDIFLAKFNSTGNLEYARSIGGSGGDGSGSCNVDLQGDVYLTGSYALTVDLDPNAGVANLQSLSGAGIFIAKYSEGCSHYAIKGSTGVLSVAQPADAYQWIICDSLNTPVAGETASSFTYPVNASYALVTTSSNGCIDTTDCYNTLTTGMEEKESSDLVLVYPNPFIASCTVQYTIAAHSKVVIDVLNNMGYRVTELITVEQPAGTYFYTLDFEEKNLVAGIYFIRIITNGKATVRKLVRIK